MTTALKKQLLSIALSFLLVFTALPFEAVGQQAAPSGSAGYSSQTAPLSGDELRQLVAPIALYPDALVAQILGAATFPDQVSAADNFLHQNSSLQGQQLMQAVNAQPWDPSVKGLTQFPSVLDNILKNLSWTSALGEAYSAGAGCDDRCTDDARSGLCSGQFEIGIADHRGAAVSADHRDPADEPPGRACADV